VHVVVERRAEAAQLGRLRERLREGRATAALFDTPRAIDIAD